MPLVSLRDVLGEAKNGSYAVGAFNVYNLEMVQAVIGAAEEERSPVIVQASAGALRYAGAGYLAAMVGWAALRARIPVVLHLDHGETYQDAMTALGNGFTSVMVDGSRLPFEDNVALTKKVAEAARALGASVEAEIGHVGGAEDDLAADGQDGLTDPAEAERFVALTGIDALAVAIGTAHGVYRSAPVLDLGRLQAIRNRVDVPLVLHGASGVPDDAVRQAVGLGITKVNIATELKLAWLGSLRESMAGDPGQTDPRRIMAPAREAVKRAVREKIRLFGSAGRG